MKYDIIDIKGSKVGSVALDKNVFGFMPNQNVVRQAILSEMTNLRQGTHSSKNRSRVNGGGKKPWKQKGRGVARAGTIRSPLWKGGGTVFGPEPHPYNHKLPKKISKLARKSVLSNKISEDKVIILDDFTMDTHKTSEFVKFLKKINLHRKKLTLLFSNQGNEKLDMAVRNLNKISLIDSRKASTYDLIDCEFLIIDKDSIGILVSMLGN
ncbi:MAG: 50S ribosomal protein L4 [Candidatus Neomarinimicrobiota bacterium]